MRAKYWIGVVDSVVGLLWLRGLGERGGATNAEARVVQADVIGLHPLQVFHGAIGLLFIALAARLWPARPAS